MSISSQSEKTNKIVLWSIKEAKTASIKLAVAGQSGVGKSATIRQLFNIAHLEAVLGVYELPDLHNQLSRTGSGI